jgi:hypothetical protein
VSINDWRLAGDTLNITCNFLYFEIQPPGFSFAWILVLDESFDECERVIGYRYCLSLPLGVWQAAITTWEEAQRREISCTYNVLYQYLLPFHLYLNNTYTGVKTFKDEAQAALFKDPVRTAL